MSTTIRCLKVLNILKSYLRAWVSYYVDKIAWSNCWRFYDTYTLNLNSICLSNEWCWAWVSSSNLYIICSLVYFLSVFPNVSTIVREFVEKVDRKTIIASDNSWINKTILINSIITRTRMSKYSNILLCKLHNLVFKLVNNIRFEIRWGRDCANTTFYLHIYS